MELKRAPHPPANPLHHSAMPHAPGDPALASRLRKVLRGEVLFDSFSRGRYSTDAYMY